MTFKSYRSRFDHSYTLGAFPTMELIRHHPHQLQSLLYHSSVNQDLLQEIRFLCPHAPLYQDEKSLLRLSPKENIWVIGVFSKYTERLHPGRHLMLVEPSNYGNLGTILRTALGFGVRDIALLGEAADSFHPQVIRSSMGARFGVRLECFPSLASYEGRFSQPLYALITDAPALLRKEIIPSSPFTLVLGNESRGLSADWTEKAHGIAIEMDPAIDSLNITVAAGIALHHFYRG